MKSLVNRSDFGSNIRSLLQDFFENDPWENRGEFVPKMNISDNDKCYKVVAELPGMEEKDFDVTIEDNLLRIKGERKDSSEDENDHYYRYESSFGSFERVLRLPESVDADSCKANFKNGVLTLEIPKNKEASKVKKLKISS